jgi:hypothetical protein
MIISDLQHLEVVDNEKIEGGLAIADASASAYASGVYFAATRTSTYTSASNYYYYYYGGSSASSNSTSSSAAD